MPRSLKDETVTARRVTEYHSVLAAVLHQKSGVSVEQAADQAVFRTIEAVENALESI